MKSATMSSISVKPLKDFLYNKDILITIIIPCNRPPYFTKYILSVNSEHLLPETIYLAKTDIIENKSISKNNTNKNAKTINGTKGIAIPTFPF